MDVSTPAGISEIKSYAINSAAPPETYRDQVTKMIRIPKPTSKKSPEHYCSEIRDNSCLGMKQGREVTNHKNPPRIEMTDIPGPNDNFSTLAPPPTPKTNANILACRKPFLTPM